MSILRAVYEFLDICSPEGISSCRKTQDRISRSLWSLLCRSVMMDQALLVKWVKYHTVYFFYKAHHRYNSLDIPEYNSDDEDEEVNTLFDNLAEIN